MDTKKWLGEQTKLLNSRNQRKNLTFGLVTNINFVVYSLVRDSALVILSWHKYLECIKTILICFIFINQLLNVNILACLFFLAPATATLDTMEWTGSMPCNVAITRCLLDIEINCLHSSSSPAWLRGRTYEPGGT